MTERVQEAPRNPFEKENDWLQGILNREGQSHLSFFGQEFDLSRFEETLSECGQEKIGEWQGLGLEPHFLPEVVLTHDDGYPSWIVKLEKWYYLKADQGKILRGVNGDWQLTERHLNSRVLLFLLIPALSHHMMPASRCMKMTIFLVLLLKSYAKRERLPNTSMARNLPVLVSRAMSGKIILNQFWLRS